MQRFGGEKIKSFMGWTGIDETAPIENRLITKSIQNAQVKGRRLSLRYQEAPVRL
ncbi:MAG: hypothetical protein Ct9H300mP27_01060 [Chloroflexota bacterium]|nr:MAG: hypothetical protein Ct9H300mP27_01060 [Chloroflexota bacterium]